MKIFQVRQGDVFIRAAMVPVGAAKKENKESGRLVLAYGEVTGHAHAISTVDFDVEAYEMGGKTYLRVQGEPANLKHEEHSLVQLPIGDYEVIIQREYTPEAIRNVVD